MAMADTKTFLLFQGCHLLHDYVASPQFSDETSYSVFE